MKIRSLEVHTANDGLRNATYVQLVNAYGLAGSGEAYPASPDLAVRETIRCPGERTCV